MVRFISGIAFPPKLGSEMRHLAIAGDIPAIFVMQCVADLALDHPAPIVAIDRLKTIWTAVFFVDRQVDRRAAVSRSA
jgi:hypothetical protein